MFVTCGYADSGFVRGEGFHACGFLCLHAYPNCWEFVQVSRSAPTVCRGLRSQRGMRHFGESGVQVSLESVEALWWAILGMAWNLGLESDVSDV